jgi:integrating conjugative element protein (TIGR03761 family)
MQNEVTKPAKKAKAKVKPAPTPAFQRDVDSPFPDQYWIEGEESVLRELIDADEPNTSDPRWARVLELERRRKLLDQMRANERKRGTADDVVPTPEAAKVNSLSQFVSPNTETMTLHTRDAFQVFTGRARSTDPSGHTIVGGARVAACIKSIWYLSENDNPYADWALISASDSIKGETQLLENESEALEEAHFRKLQQRGLSYEIAVASVPQTVELRFKSPYGFMIAELISAFDFYVRVVRTLIRRDRMTDNEGREAIYIHKRKIRGVFELPAKYEHVLNQETMRLLSRADFGKEVDAAGVLRVAVARKAFGPVPNNIFSGELQPRHSKRRVTVTQQELAALHAAAAGQHQDAGTTSTDNEQKLL